MANEQGFDFVRIDETPLVARVQRLKFADMGVAAEVCAALARSSGQTLEGIVAKPQPGGVLEITFRSNQPVGSKTTSEAQTRVNEILQAMSNASRSTTTRNTAYNVEDVTQQTYGQFVQTLTASIDPS